MCCEKHMNLYTIFKRAQLLERFGALRGVGFHFTKRNKAGSSKTVDALVPQILIVD